MRNILHLVVSLIVYKLQYYILLEINFFVEIQKAILLYDHAMTMTTSTMELRV